MVEKIGVVGAGLMGSEIALVFALAGYNVLMHDRDQDTLHKAAQRQRSVLEKGVDREFYAKEQMDIAIGNIEYTTSLDRFSDRDFITEAVFEDAGVKEGVIRTLDGVCKPSCYIATNTSTIPISTLAAFVSEERRARFIGTHYFSPVSRMKLVEVIPAFSTAEETTAHTIALLERIGKAPIRVKDVTGFAVNRMLHMFIIEAVKLVEEGVATPEDLDTACRLGLGHPIGPFALMDAVTSSLCVQAQEIMQESYGERFRPPQLLKQRVRAGYTGGKGKPGWLQRN